MDEPSIEIAPDLTPILRIATIVASPVAVGPASPALDAEFAAVAAETARRFAGKLPSEIEGLRPARDLYRACGVDPTRTRPSSEALLRRAVQGKPMPRIQNAVDVCNLCSLAFLLPIGLYDADRLAGPVTLRRGRAGESYAGIRKDEVHLDGRLTLCDAAGPFGNPTSDSQRTSVGEGTRRLWMVIFAPAELSPGAIEAHARFAESAMVRHLAGAGAPVSTSVRMAPSAPGH